MNTKFQIVKITSHDSESTILDIPFVNLRTKAMALTRLGAYSGQVDGRETGLYYPSIAGSGSVIGALYLMSNGVQIAVSQEPTTWSAVVNVKASNRYQEDITRFDAMNGLTFSLDETGAYTLRNPLKSYASRYTAAASDPGVERFNNQTQIAGVQFNTDGMIFLHDYFPILQDREVLRAIPNLQLVIVWKPSSQMPFVNDIDAPTQPAGVTFTPVIPQLLIEEDLAYIAPAVDTLDYDEIVLQTLTIPAAVDGIVSNNTIPCKVFMNRTVKDIMIFNKPLVNKAWSVAAERSVAQVDESIQFIVNGKKLLPYNGIVTHSQKANQFAEIYGDICVPYACYLPSLVDTNGNILRNDDAATAAWSSNVMIGNFSLGGVRINRFIDTNLELVYGRTGWDNGRADDDQRASFNMLLYGRCPARLVFNGDSVSKVGL